eukprot:TRINITY_DN4908_c0_g1_i1.p1 TRINITY_DN4908_c0_g1~~TRINITY_DN4908_c0_g1_i1.p1  ORF type:complete len:793 (-),score=171.07 TRINITY_DN4908_c0_g1_i1:23-2269(-)
MALYSFGASTNGQLGLGVPNTKKALEPTLIESLKGKKIMSVVCGEQHSMAIAELGDVYVWGRGREGQIGNGERMDSNLPVQVKELRHQRIIQADCGSHHCIALTATGIAYTWGKLFRKGDPNQKNNNFGFAIEMPGMRAQKMIDKSMQAYFKGDTEDVQQNNDFGNFVDFFQTVPRIVPGLSKVKISSVAAGYNFSLACSEEGQLYSWGFNEKGQLGHGHRFNTEDPCLVERLSGVQIVGVGAGQQHSIVLSADGHVYSFGLGVFGQLGHGSLADELYPRRIEALMNSEVQQVSCGAYYSAALTAAGRVLSWGHGEYGQHGGTANYADWATGENESGAKDKHHYHATPRALGGLDHVTVRQVACGQLHTVAVADNAVYTWGWGESGCLGHGDRRFHLVPKEVEAVRGRTVSCAAAGWKHSLLVEAQDDSTFALDFKPLLEHGRYTDVQLVAGNKTFSLHRIILCARCPHLRRMDLFHTRFCGGVARRWVIQGVKATVMTAFLQYLYTDHVRVAPHLAGELCQLATRWGVDRLASMCKVKVLQRHLNLSLSQWKEDLSACIDGEYSDVTFRLKGDTVSAHKALLICRCPYFERLMEGQFKEKSQAVFDLDESLTKPVFLAVLQYLYTGDETIIHGDNCVDLLMASDRLMLDDLKQMVETFIEGSVDLDNVAWLIEISDRFGAHRLKRVCLELITQNRDNWLHVLNSAGFRDICVSSPHLLREIDFKASKLDFITVGEIFAHQRQIGIMC